MEEDNLKQIISNVISFKNFIDTVVDEVKAGEYNTMILKKISDMAEDFFGNMGEKEDEEDKPKYKFNPRTVMEPDTSDDEINDGFLSDSDDEEPKKKVTNDMIENEFERLQNLLQKTSISTPVKKDNLVEDFLNNTLDLTKYHYSDNNISDSYYVY